MPNSLISLATRKWLKVYQEIVQESNTSIIPDQLIKIKTLSVLFDYQNIQSELLDKFFCKILDYEMDEKCEYWTV